MNADPWSVYDLIRRQVREGIAVDQLVLGLTWTYCLAEGGIGFAQSPGVASRLLEFPGTMAGREAAAVAGWLTSWDPFEATIGLAAANAVINGPANSLMAQAQQLTGPAPANLAVFEYFRPRLVGRKVVVIGRYPGLDAVLDGLDVSVIERQPGPGDLPDPSAELLIPQADWVFLTATSLINKTFPRLSELARNAVTVLMGPSTPWLDGLSDFGVDFLAGVIPVNAAIAARIAGEGGGTRLFGEGVCYAVADIGAQTVAALKDRIADIAMRRTAMRRDMDAWYEQGNRKRFPRHAELEDLTAQLAQLDTAYKRQWDARNRAQS
ncbi:MAG: DUF364 domain-containing protein [Sedimenticolaceae bacterium]